MTNILIPTDFTAASLAIASQAVKTLEGRQVDIVLFHAFALPFYVQDLLGSAADRQPYHDLITDGFRHACKQLKEQHPKTIGRIMFKFMTGDTVALFRNFIDANDIDMIICPGNYTYTKIHTRSIDPLPLFKKAGIPVLRDMKPSHKEINYTVRSFLTQELAVN